MDARAPWGDVVPGAGGHARGDVGDAARHEGIEQFVYVSAWGVSEDHPSAFMRAKAAAESHLRESGVPATILRPTLFMESWIGAFVVAPVRAGRPVDAPAGGVAVDSLEDTGSDAGNLTTRAVRDGDDYVINGQKIWTSGAQFADWMFCLVRTDPKVKHDGITFILFDMTTPGVSVRPIRLISGVSPFCQTFFDNVKSRCARSPKRQRWR